MRDEKQNIAPIVPGGGGVTAAGMSRRGLLLTAALAVVATGCSSGGTSSAPSQPSLEKKTVKVGAVQSVTAAGLYLAAQQGYFADQGLQVKIQAIQGAGKAIPFLLNGTLDIVFGNYVSFLEAQARGVATMRILAEGCVAGPGLEVVLVMPNSGIKSAPDLRGKLIGVNATADVSQLLIGSVLAASGIPLSAVRFTVIPFPDMAAALKSGKVNAGWFTEPYKTEAETKYGAQVLFDSDQGATTSFPIAGTASTAAWAQKYPNTAAAFVRGMQKGNALADSSRADIEKVLPIYTTISRQTATLISTGTFPTTNDAARLQRIANDMKTFGLITRPVNVSQMLAT